MSIYCPKCGSKNEQAHGKTPNFCSSCGANLKQIFAAMAGIEIDEPVLTSPPRRERPSFELDDTEEFDNEPIRFDKAVEINMAKKGDNVFKGGELLGAGGTGTSREHAPVRSKSKRVKEVNEFAKKLFAPKAAPSDIND